MAGTISDKLTHLDGTKTAIRQAIVDKGVDVPEGTPFRQYADKVSEISGGGGGGGDGWTRPADRPPLPWGEGEITEDNTIYMLFAVMPGAPNDYAITLTGAPYTATWGDDTSNNYSSGAKAEHIFDYDSIAVTPNSEGIKWVWMLFRPQGTGDFTGINTTVAHSSRPVPSSSNIYSPQVYEIYMRSTKVAAWPWSTLAYVRYYSLNIFFWFGANEMASFKFFLCFSYTLKRLVVNTSGAREFIGFLSNCLSFNQPLDNDMSNGESFDEILNSCYSFNQPLTFNVGTHGATLGNAAMGSFYSFNQSLNIIGTPTGQLTGFLQGARSLNKPIYIDTSKIENISYSFQNMSAYSHSLTIDLASLITPMVSTFTGCLSMTGLRLLNMGTINNTLNVAGNSMSANALALLFGDLCNRTSLSAGTITITKAFGAAHLTPAQRAIATAKNWTISG